jgi:hypothetical protein
LINKSLGTSYTSSLVNTIIKELFTGITKEIVEGYLYKFPAGLGYIYLRKFSPFSYRDDSGKIITNKPIDLNATLNLWKNNPEAKEKKIKVRFENYNTNGDIIKFRYDVKRANYPNKGSYKFRFNRSARAILHTAILAGKHKL